MKTLYLLTGVALACGVHLHDDHRHVGARELGTSRATPASAACAKRLMKRSALPPAP